MSSMGDLARASTPGGIEYQVGGLSGKGLLVFTHGYRDSAEGWQWVAEGLIADGWRVALVQRTAVSDSDGSSGEHLEAYAAQVEAVVKAVAGPGEGVVLIGQSMGGPVAELVGRCLPDLRALVLVNPAPLGGIQLPPEVLAGFKAGTKVSDPEALALIKLDLCVNHDDDTKARLVASSPVESEASALQTLMSWVDGHPLGAEPSVVTAPALLVVTDDQFFSAGMLRTTVASRFADIQVAEVHGAGHFPHIERPGEVAAAIAAFLDKLPANGGRVLRAGSRPAPKGNR